MNDPSTVRRINANAAFRIFAEEQLAAGAAPKGLEQAFAEQLQIKPSLWSMAKSGKRPIGDKLARQIEARIGKPAGWMDQEREPEGLSPAEQHFLAIALQAYRKTNAEGRRRMRLLLKDFNP